MPLDVIDTTHLLEIEKTTAGNYLAKFEAEVPGYQSPLPNLGKKFSAIATADIEPGETKPIRLYKDEAQWLYNAWYNRMRELAYDYNDALHWREVADLTNLAAQLRMDLRIQLIPGTTSSYEVYEYYRDRG